MAGCDGNYWESARNSQRRCKSGGSSGSSTAPAGPGRVLLIIVILVDAYPRNGTIPMHRHISIMIIFM